MTSKSGTWCRYYLVLEMPRIDSILRKYRRIRKYKFSFVLEDDSDWMGESIISKQNMTDFCLETKQSKFFRWRLGREMCPVVTLNKSLSDLLWAERRYLGWKCWISKAGRALVASSLIAAISQILGRFLGHFWHGYKNDPSPLSLLEVTLCFVVFSFQFISL